MRCTKAIIPVAGWGTRWLPLTKSIEKCMLPVCNRPAVDYTVQDCIAAGIKDIYFVVSERSSQLRAYYQPNKELNDYLASVGKPTMIPPDLPTNVKLHFVVQLADGRYGTAIPTSLIFSELAEGEPLLVVGGDDFVYSPDQTHLKTVLAAAEDGKGVIVGAELLEGDISRFGVLEPDEMGNFKRIVEKPALGEEPSRLINISQYVLPYEAVREVYDFAQTTKLEGEYYIIDAINTYVAKGGSLKVVKTSERYCDTGTPASWLETNNFIAAQQSQSAI